MAKYICHYNIYIYEINYEVGDLIVVPMAEKIHHFIFDVDTFKNFFLENM